jgi:hypothetical protein
MSSPYPPNEATPVVTGTPLGRIVLGVFLGFFLALLAWTAVVAVIMVAVTATFASVLHDAVDDIVDESSPTSSAAAPPSTLSVPCREAVVAVDAADERAVEALLNSPACAGDDSTAILEYLGRS